MHRIGRALWRGPLVKFQAGSSCVSSRNITLGTRNSPDVGDRHATDPNPLILLPTNHFPRKNTPRLRKAVQIRLLIVGVYTLQVRNRQV